MATEKDIQETGAKEDLNFLMETLKIARENPDKTINKAVGALIVKNGKIIGKGYRITKVLNKNPYRDITYHAEHVALMNAHGNVNGATLYTTLEPCTKRSKGPGWDAPEPCCEIIAKSGVEKVVIGSFDEDFGQGGAKYLLERGVKVFRVRGIDEKKFKNLINNPLIANDEARKLQEEFYGGLKKNK